MESVFAVFDGEKFVAEKPIVLKKGQKVIVTILEEDILPLEEGSYTYATALKSGAFNYLFEEGEEDYSLEDCKIRYK